VNAQQAERALEGAELVPCVEGSLASARELVTACLEAEIPAAVGAPRSCKSGGCSPKAQVLVRPEDAERVSALLRARWLEALEQEGLAPIVPASPTGAGGAGSEEGEPPCPACGTAAPLVAGACSDCGLQLE
jgi:hypothetical protein